MPYKDKEKARESARERQKKHRQGVTGEGVTNINKEDNVTPQMLHRPNGEDYNPDELLKDGRKRYIGPLSDGQVLDRLTVSPLDKYLPVMVLINRADKIKLGKGMSKQRRLAMIIQSLDKDVTGLDSRKENLLSMVRYGIGGMTLAEVRSEL